MPPPEAVAGLVTQPGSTGALTVRPLVYGYIRLGPADPLDAGACLVRELAAYAQREGLTLADVFTDQYAEGGEQLSRSAFVVMVELLRRPGVSGVLIPSRAVHWTMVIMTRRLARYQAAGWLPGPLTSAA